MKKLIIFFSFLFPFISFTQVESNNRKIDFTPPKTKTVLPNVTLLNPDAFTFKKEVKRDLPKGMMNSNDEYFLNPNDVYKKRLNKEKPTFSQTFKIT